MTFHGSLSQRSAPLAGVSHHLNLVGVVDAVKVAQTEADGSNPTTTGFSRGQI